jgi:hypothetical protein
MKFEAVYIVRCRILDRMKCTFGSERYQAMAQIITASRASRKTFGGTR